MEICKINPRRSRSSDYAELGHFALLGSLRTYYGNAEDNVD